MSEAITVIGSLGADPMLKSVNGDRVAEFRLACKSRRKEGDTWVDGHTNWFSIEAWGRFADHVGASLRRGDLVMVLGRLKVDQWEAGDRRGTSVKIRAEHIGHSLRVGPALRQRSSAPGAASELSGDATRPEHAEVDDDPTSGWGDESGSFPGVHTASPSTAEPDAAWARPGAGPLGA
ncbi:single-stranded DNA-binding protein [Agrococcus sp. ProA11]|uniref:single-stranded DNA-binding protein n=1 Tax=Agrococcus chionoecetis TaxID=3153752 RepID=UPI0032605164